MLCVNFFWIGGPNKLVSIWNYLVQLAQVVPNLKSSKQNIFYRSLSALSSKLGRMCLKSLIILSNGRVPCKMAGESDILLRENQWPAMPILAAVEN